jgi:hypothetical protein
LGNTVPKTGKVLRALRPKPGAAMLWWPWGKPEGYRYKRIQHQDVVLV